MVQPQPHGGSTLQWEMTGEEALGAGSQGSLMASSQGSLRVPPELAGNEVVHRLLSDNHQLREALKRSNDALKDRCEEMEGWQRRSREEREFLSCKFREARALVERLAQENQSLLGKLNYSSNHTATQSPGNYIVTGGQNKNLEGSNAESNGLMDSPGTLEETEQKHGVEEDAERQAVHQSLVSSENSSVSSYSASMRDSLSYIEGLQRVEGEGRACQPSEGSNEFLRLLKSHKEKLEEGMRELRKRNEELEKEKMDSEKEKESLLATVDQLRVKLTQFPQQVVLETEETQCNNRVLNTNAMTVSPESSHLAKLTEQLQATQGRYRELQEKLNVLEHNSIQRDRIEAVLKQKEKDCIQLTKDTDALRAQVTSLLGELHERQTCLEKCEEERKRLEEKLRSKTESLQNTEREMDQQKKQHFVTMDKLLLQTQNLEAALKNERNVIVEERRKLAQLQHAYTCLFQDYDNKLKMEKQANHRGGETETLTNRLEEAEKALALKQAHIDKLKEELEQQRSLQETVQVLTAQAEIYKLDFQAEREARETLNQKKEEMQDKLNRALAEINLLKQENMQQRHKDDFRPHLTPPALKYLRLLKYLNILYFSDVKTFAKAEFALGSQQPATEKMMRIITAVLALCLGLCAAETCTDPAISTSSYTTTDALISSETVFIVELSLVCGNGAQTVALYADVNGKQFPVTRGQDVGKYQVSWSIPHKQASSGTYQVKFFDEESYSALRKAQRNDEDVEAIKPLFTVNVDHRGAWSGPWVSTEVLAAVIGIILYYLAYSTKSSIQA
ncbi:hypothetical protein NFI96_028869 [Prochilodus magdalenae]|nr:hypothetical protein NFI96_028869 [Prochilodus magdalenae]